MLFERAGKQEQTSTETTEYSNSDSLDYYEYESSSLPSTDDTRGKLSEYSRVILTTVKPNSGLPT
jgi:hypothetical protein